jgi:MFS family permease
VSLDVRSLYANSPVSAIGCLLIGVANGAWGTLGAVYGARIGISTASIALMMSLTVVAGAAMQMPVGKLSDMTDRRNVLAAAAAGSALVALLIVFIQPRGDVLVISLTAAYGALAYTLYSIAVAHANDHAEPGNFVKVSGGLLLLYGFGTMIGPVVGAVLMDRIEPGRGLSCDCNRPHPAGGLHRGAYTRPRRRSLQTSRSAFKTMPSERAATPELSRLDPRSEQPPDSR